MRTDMREKEREIAEAQKLRHCKAVKVRASRPVRVEPFRVDRRLTIPHVRTSSYGRYVESNSLVMDSIHHTDQTTVRHGKCEWGGALPPVLLQQQ